VEFKYALMLLAVGVTVITTIGFQVVRAQGVNPCPVGQIPAVDPSGKIKIDPSTGSPICIQVGAVNPSG
jgi:hypothetical protein